MSDNANLQAAMELLRDATDLDDIHAGMREFDVEMPDGMIGF